jgi:hypothetical protein
MYHTNRGELDLAQRIAEDLLRRSQQRADRRNLILAHFCLGTTFLPKGEFAAARLSLGEVNRLYAPDDTPVFIQQFGVHPRAMSLTFLGSFISALAIPIRPAPIMTLRSRRLAANGIRRQSLRACP